MDEGEVRSNAVLEDKGQWEFAAAEARPGVVKARAVVSVAFSREDFERVSECAESMKMRTSEFIREAALEKVARPVSALVTASSSGPQRVETRLSTPNHLYVPVSVDARSGVGAA